MPPLLPKASLCAHLRSCCDTCTHALLFSHAQVEGKGLAGLVEAQLGQRLDKRLQCSSWSKRPLQPDQRAYAALDAAVLLLLLDSFIAVAPPKPAPHAGSEHLQQTDGCCSAHSDTAAVVHSSAETGSEQSRVLQGSEGSKTGQPERSRAQVEEQQNGYASSGDEDSHAASQLADDLKQACSVNQGQPESSYIVTVKPEIPQGLQVSMHGRGLSGLAACEEKSSRDAASLEAGEGSVPGCVAQNAVRRAAAAWGTRLEVGGAPAKQKRDRKPGVKKLTAAEAPGEEFGELSPSKSYLNLESFCTWVQTHKHVLCSSPAKAGFFTRSAVFQHMFWLLQMF